MNWPVRHSFDEIYIYRNYIFVVVIHTCTYIVNLSFFQGDRLTDERIQCAQHAMENETTPLNRLEGFVSKIEDFHRLMNFLEVDIFFRISLYVMYVLYRFYILNAMNMMN